YLLALGVERHTLALALVAVQAQQLIRKVCKDCKQHWSPKQKQVDDLHIDEDLLRRFDLPHVDVRSIRLSQGQGCDYCNRSGHRNRMGAFEQVVVDDAIREALLRRAPAGELALAARAGGTLTLRESALRKALLGMTT